MTPCNVEYSVLEAALESAASPLSAAEIHGGLCGVMCVAGVAGSEQWLEHCLEDCEPAGIEAGGLAGMLESVRDASWAALSGAELEFAPFLPGDDATLEERVGAIAFWCHGFLAGLALGGFRPEHVDAEDREDIDEVVRDFAEIGRAGVDASDDDEAGAMSLIELTEFVRVGVQLVFEQLGASCGRTGSTTIH